MPRGTAIVAVAACMGLIAGVGLRHLAYYPLQVTSNSMSPTVVAGDWVVVSARKTTVNRGDIVVFRYPFGSTGRAIKRVVAVAGDMMPVHETALRVNSNATFADDAMAVPAGHFYILGDNTTSSVDGRTLGLLPEQDVVGNVAAIVRKPW